MSNPKSGLVSVVLVNFRGAQDTLACIRELLAVDWPADLLEIVVVDNASGDDSLEQLHTVDDPRVRIVESPENTGFAGGSNLGARSAKGEIVAFLNNDARPDRRWIAEAVATFDSRPEIGAVASKVLDWEGERVDFVDAAVTWYGMGYKPHTGETDREEWSTERDVLFGTGAAMFVRREVFEELGGFDESYFMFYEDVDFGWRLNLAGYRFRFQPRSLAFHKHHASMKEFGSYREEFLLERNALATLYKNLDDDSLARVLPGALLLAVRRAVSRGELDSSALDLRNRGNEAELSMPVAKSAMAGLFAIDRFVDGLGDLDAKRAQIVIAALEGAFNGTVAHLHLRNLGHPLFPAAVPRGQFLAIRVDERRRRRAYCLIAGYRREDCAPLAVWRDRDPVREGVLGDVRSRCLDKSALPDILPDPMNG